MTDARPMLIGMNNPLSSDPEHALYPHPPGCTGNRIFRMLAGEIPGITEDQYLERFDRRNLIGGRAWPVGVGAKQHHRLAAQSFLKELEGSERRVVLLGRDVQAAFDVRLPPLSYERARAGWWVICLPHPSGLNRWYNEGSNEREAARLLARLYRG